MGRRIGIINFSKTDIDSEPSIEEPAREYYFIAKCRELVEDFGLSVRVSKQDSEKLL